MSIVALADWYPSMYSLWVSEGRRLEVPIGDRKGFTVHHTLGGGRQGSLSYARSVAHRDVDTVRIDEGALFIFRDVDGRTEYVAYPLTSVVSWNVDAPKQPAPEQSDPN